MHGLGFAKNVPSGQELWNQLALGAFNGENGPFGPGDSAGIVGWNLGTLAVGEQTSFTVFKGLTLSVPPPSVQAVPEPGSLVLMGAGLAALGLWRRRA